MSEVKQSDSVTEDKDTNHQELEYTSPEKALKSANGIVLIPQPSNNPDDPLLWPMSKKVMTLAIVSLASFIGLAQALTNQAGFFVQGAVYHKTPVEMSYSISASIVGLATGPLIWAPLSQYIGRSSCIFWGMLGTLAMCVWGGCMTGEDDYIPFVISRWLSGTFGSAPSTIGAGTILDIFFLHQRGKAFVCYTLCTLFGTQFGPTMGGFILKKSPWPVQFWWVVGVEGLVVILVFFFLQETRFPRDSTIAPSSYKPPSSFLSNRLTTFFPGNKIVPPNLPHNSPSSTFLIALCPVSLLAGGFLMISFGWAVAVTTLMAVFLQTPVIAGGYGFSPLQNAEFSFGQWMGIFVAEIYGMLVNDRVPLWICKRRGGIWKPEYRLYPLLIPPFFLLPVALGLFGASLQYHLHYMVLALAVFLINLCEVAIVPVVINYVVESFTDHAGEVTTVLNFYRLILGLLVPFFIEPWEKAVGPGWVFGMMAFFTVFAFSFMALLAWRGPAVRSLSFRRFRRSEEGATLTVASAQQQQEEVEKL